MNAYGNLENFPKSNEPMLKCTLSLLLLLLPPAAAAVVVVVADNNELNDLYSSPNIVLMRWAGLVACMERRYVYTGFRWGKT